MIGLGMGILVWGTVNCIVGWATGRFGLFGINPSIPEYPMVNYLGLLMVVVGGFLFAQIRPTLNTDVDEYSAVNIEEEQNEEHNLLGDEIVGEPDVAITGNNMPRSFKRSLGLGLSLIAGMLYGVTFVPVIYIQDHKEDVKNF
uniref:Uncharacterized protein n=1 Tax=Panagrolaimus sp. PS1159 TaxID=55785 RepID=A0AC35EXF9_9BILA